MRIFFTRQLVSRRLLALPLAAYVAFGGLMLRGEPETTASVPPSRAIPQKAKPADGGDLKGGSVHNPGSHLRDPFRPLEEVMHDGAAVAPRPIKPRPPGMGGLLVDQVRLQGIVREEVTHQMTAMIASQNNLSYFVHENDQLYDGVVSRITPDALFIRRTGFAPRGRAGEVVLRLGPGAEAQQ